MRICTSSSSHVVALEVGRVADQHDGVAVPPRPLDVDAEVSGILDDPIEDVVGRHRQDPGADLLQGQLDGVPLGDPRPGHDGDHRLDAALAELEGEDDAIQLEEHARLVDLRRDHAYCSPEYVKRFGTPRTLDELDAHRIITLADGQVAPHLQNRNWLVEAGRNGTGPREAYFRVNNILGLVRACQQGLGIAALPDYLVEDNSRLVQLFGESDSIQLDTYFVYPEELKTVARVQVFRDFVVSKAQRWPS